MHTQLPVENDEYLMDFAYVKARELWPEAVVLDQGADLQLCHRPHPSPSAYGFDIFRSQPDVEQLFSGDSESTPPSVNVSWSAGMARVGGDDVVVKHLAEQPIWSSRNTGTLP